MVYKCLCCSSPFDEPDVVELNENLDGERGYWRHREARCPWCGSEEIEEVQDGDDD